MDHTARLGESDRIRQQIVEHLTHPRFIGNKFLGVIGHCDMHCEFRTQRGFAHTENCSLQNCVHIDGAQIQLHCASVYCCQIENIVDDGK